MSKYLYVLLLLMGFHGHTADLRDIITSEFNSLKLLAREPNAYLEFEDMEDHSSRSMPGGKVIINIPQLTSLIRKVGAKHENFVIRLIVAHELAHQAQYRRYGKAMSELLMECQADIIAGFFIYQQTGKDYYQDSGKTVTSDNILVGFQDALNAVFELGDDYRTDHTHPKKEQRRAALRDGIAYGSFWLFHHVSKDVTLPREQRETAKTSHDHLIKLLDYAQGEDVLAWSMKHANKILHGDRSACKGLVFRNEISWDTSSANPFVYYKHHIQNISRASITIDFSDQVYTALRNDSNNSLFWDLRNTNANKKTIKDGEAITIQGKIAWVASKELMPLIIVPGMDGSIYTCKIPGTASKSEATYRFLGARNANKPDVLAQSIIGVLYSNREKIADFIDGVGTTDDIGPIESVAYQCDLPVPDVFDTRINYFVEEDLYSLHITFYEGSDKEAAELALQRIHQLVQKGIPDIRIEINNDRTRKNDHHNYRFWDITDQGKVTGEISYRHFSPAELFIVYLAINSK